MSLQRVTSIVLFLFFAAQNVHAAKSEFGEHNTRFYSSNKSLEEYKDASLRSIRLLQEKQALQMDMEEINSQQRARSLSALSDEPAIEEASSIPVEAEIPALIQQVSFDVQMTINPETDLIYGELFHNQQLSPLGLVVSYTQQAGLWNQGFTYDQALAGIAMLKQGDAAGAGRILDFLKSKWDGTGLDTVYNTQIVNGWVVEQDKILGPNAWVSLLAIQYHAVTGDAAALDFAVQIAKWALTLPQTSGGFAMGKSDTAWADRYSVENNLSLFGVLQFLANDAADLSDRQYFSGARDRLKEWLKHPGFAPSEGLFRRGAYLDSLKALDTSTWGILALGVSGLSDIGVDVDDLVATIEREYMVNHLEGYGSYGGDVFSSKGFDFSYSTNSFLTGRSALKWVEGTNQMITVYKYLAAYYSNPATLDTAMASHYTTRADYFSGLNANDRILTAGGSSYTYADRPDTQIFFDVPGWRTTSGPSIAASAWVYYSLYGFNPFEKISS